MITVLASWPRSVAAVDKNVAAAVPMAAITAVASS